MSSPFSLGMSDHSAILLSTLSMSALAPRLMKVPEDVRTSLLVPLPVFASTTPERCRREREVLIM